MLSLTLTFFSQYIFSLFSFYFVFVLTVSVMAFFTGAVLCEKQLSVQSSRDAHGGQSPSASVCFLALSRRSAMLEFLLLLLAAAATAAAAEAESASEAIGSPNGGGGNIR